jgi:large subunit ribosomal protein L23
MQVLITPVITEKSLGKIAEGRYVFKVSSKANKASIAVAIEELYKVDVVAVRIINVKGKLKLIRGRFPSQKKDWKKAIISLKKGQKIAGFEE